MSKPHTFTSKERDKPQRHVRELQDDVLRWIRDHRGPNLFRDIKSGTHIDLLSNPVLLNNLRAHERIIFEENTLAYRPVHPGINGINDLRTFLNRHRQGLSESSLLDAYVGVGEDIQSLKSLGEIIFIPNSEAKEVMLYPKDIRLQTDIDEDIKMLWQSVIMPSDDLELERELHGAGLLSIEELETGHQESQRRKRPAKRTREANTEKKRRRYQVTNVHVLDQFKFLQDSAK